MLQSLNDYRVIVVPVEDSLAKSIGDLVTDTANVDSNLAHHAQRHHRAALAFLDRHVQGAQIVLEFQVDGPLGGRKMYLFDLEFARNLVDLCNILEITVR